MLESKNAQPRNKMMIERSKPGRCRDESGVMRIPDDGRVWASYRIFLSGKPPILRIDQGLPWAGMARALAGTGCACTDAHGSSERLATDLADLGVAGPTQALPVMRRACALCLGAAGIAMKGVSGWTGGVRAACSACADASAWAWMVLLQSASRPWSKGRLVMSSQS